MYPALGRLIQSCDRCMLTIDKSMIEHRFGTTFFVTSTD